MLTRNTCWEATQRVMVAKLSRLTHKIVIQLHIVAESCVIFSPRSRRPVRKLLDTPSYVAIITDLELLIQIVCFYTLIISYLAYLLMFMDVQLFINIQFLSLGHRLYNAHDIFHFIILISDIWNLYYMSATSYIFTESNIKWMFFLYVQYMCCYTFWNFTYID
jgi:hypothetical protein